MSFPPEKGVSVFFHIPDGFSDLGTVMLDCIQRILEFVRRCVNVDTSLTLKEEIIAIRTEKAGPQVESKIHDIEQFNEVLRSAKTPKGGHGEIIYLNGAGKKVGCLYGFAVERSEFYSEYMIKNEKKLVIIVDQQIWNAIDQTRILEMVKEMQALLHATYVCVGDTRKVPSTIYYCNLRIWGKDNYKIDPEDKVPGVYWLQYISRRMVDGCENISEYIDKKRFSVEPVVVSGRVEGFWIQSTKDVTKMRTNDRLLLRTCLQKFSYEISLEMLIKHYRGRSTEEIVTIMKDIKFPLYKEELEYILTQDASKYWH